jgi:hypothetical protein
MSVSANVTLIFNDTRVKVIQKGELCYFLAVRETGIFFMVS